MYLMRLHLCVALILSDKENMSNCRMREPWACPPEPRTHGRVEIEGTDEVTAQRYLSLATLKAPQNLPQYDLDLAEAKYPHGLGCVEVELQPNPVYYHATDVMVVDGLGGPRVQPDEAGRHVQLGLRAGRRVGGLPCNHPHGSWNRPFRLPDTPRTSPSFYMTI